MTRPYNLTIGWLYPDLMSTYGDRGNVIVLSKRAQWRGIEVVVKKISVAQPTEDLVDCDMLFMGGAQDLQQEIVTRDLESSKGANLIKLIENNIPALFICGAYQFMGKYYKAADGTIIKGLSIFDLYTESPGESSPRMIGNITVQPLLPGLKDKNLTFVGFENHGGRTFISDSQYAFGTVINGFGNNGADKTEGIAWKNAIGTYLHGPILTKNPELADYMIEKAIEKKYGEKIELESIENVLESKAKDVIIGKTGV